MLVVAVAVVGSLTVLPASLALLGDRVDKGRLPWLGKRLQARRERGPSRFWTRVLEPVLAHPARSAAIAALALLILAAPALRLHTEVLGPSEELPHRLAIMQGLRTAAASVPRRRAARLGRRVGHRCQLAAGHRTNWRRCVPRRWRAGGCSSRSPSRPTRPTPRQS